MSDYRGVSISGSISADNIRGAAQIGRSANQINCCDPYSSDCRAANTQAIFVALKEEITAAAPVRRLEKGNVNTTFLSTSLRQFSYWYRCQRCKSGDKFQNPKKVAPVLMLVSIVLDCQSLLLSEISSAMA